jgi:hypothetical protein
MDPCFNRCVIPPSNSTCLVIRPVAKTFITGLEPAYDSKVPLPPTFVQHGLSDREFRHILEAINDTLFSAWPCTLCQLFGYCFCPCTLGLSFLIPNVDVRQAREKAERLLSEINLKVLHEKGLELDLKLRCSTSWLELRVSESLGGVELGINDK